MKLEPRPHSRFGGAVLRTATFQTEFGTLVCFENFFGTSKRGPLGKNLGSGGQEYKIYAPPIRGKDALTEQKPRNSRSGPRPERSPHIELFAFYKSPVWPRTLKSEVQCSTRIEDGKFDRPRRSRILLHHFCHLVLCLRLHPALFAALPETRKRENPLPRATAAPVAETRLPE